MYLRLLACFAAIVIPLSQCDAQHWPAWQGNQRRTSSTDHQLRTAELSLDWVWESSTPPQSAWAGPAKYDAYAFHRNLPAMRNYDPVFHLIAADGHVWFGSSVDDSLYCLDAKDGKEQWVFTTDGPIRLAPTWSDNRVYFGSDDGLARCVDAKTGDLIWQFSPSKGTDQILHNGRLIPFQPCRTGVCVDDGIAWFANSLLPWKSSYLCALDAKTGKASGSQHYVQSIQNRTMEGSPALSSDTLIFPQGRVAPRVYDRHSGKDRGDMAKSGGGSIVVVSINEDVLHGPATDSRKGGFRKSSGETREMVAALGRGNSLAVDGTKSWMLTDDSIVATDLATNKEHWRVSCDCPFTIIKAGDTLFVGGDHQVAAYSVATGKRVWHHNAKGRIFGLAAADDRLFATSDTGAIHCYSVQGKFSLEQATQTITEQKTDPLRSIPADDDDRLLGHWAFQASHASDNKVRSLRGSELTLVAPPRFSRLGQYQAIELDGAKESAMVTPDFKTTLHPETNFTAEAWVRLDQLQEWGGIIGIIQDNGSDEQGWLLGYRKNRFCIAVRGEKGPGKLTYLSSESTFELSNWYHVVGSYDGSTMRLFVNGKLQATSDDQAGKIVYPKRAWFEIGAYHDKDEYFRMKGALHEVRLYNKALSQADATERYERTRNRIPLMEETVTLESGPWLKFTDPESAVVRWTTQKPQPTRLELVGRRAIQDTKQVVVDETLRTEHTASLSNLQRNSLYHYRIGIAQDGEVRFTTKYECDNFFNYSPPSVARIKSPLHAKAASLAKSILRQTTFTRGQCLVVGQIDPNLLTELARQSQMRFVVAALDRAYIDTTRAVLRSRGVYGNQVTVRMVTNLDQMPFPANWANLVVIANQSSLDVFRESMRQTRPNGGVTLAFHAPPKSTVTDFESVKSGKEESWYRYAKPALSGAGQWTHLYGDPDNSAFGGEQLAGATTIDELEVQWIGRPGPRYQADRSGRKPSPLSVNGRLFLQGLNRIIAVDAFNGTVIWSLEIPGFERFNMPRDCSNWCANAEYLFAIVKDECWKIDAKTGQVIQRESVQDDSPNQDNTNEWGYVSATDKHLYGSEVRGGSSWTSFWGGGDAGWYDARSGAVTHPVCSDRLFRCDANSMQRQWTYEGGLVLNPTITFDQQNVYFVESRSQRLIDGNERRIGDPELWETLFLVALDADTGNLKWEKRLPEMSSQVVIYLAHASGQLTLVTSADKQYTIRSLSDADGMEKWTQTAAWPGGKGDHGKAMMRPAIAGDRIFIRPHVLSLTSGEILPERMPDGHGCGTYACSSKAIFYRARTITMWDPVSNEKSTWARLRPDCWLSTIPAGGMLLSPEGGGGCSCGSWLETSLGFMPRAHNTR